MNFRDTRGRQRPEPNIELTPLIDVVFLLLIFFLITTTFVRSDNNQLPLNLPSAAAGESMAQGERTIVYVGAEGGLQIDDEIVKPGEVSGSLERLYAENPETHLLIKGDKVTSYGHVPDVIDEARRVGFKRVNLVVKRKAP
jgi:biopolymer transport protein ExbD